MPFKRDCATLTTPYDSLFLYGYRMLPCILDAVKGCSFPGASLLSQL